MMDPSPDRSTCRHAWFNPPAVPIKYLVGAVHYGLGVRNKGRHPQPELKPERSPAKQVHNVVTIQITVARMP